MEQEEKTSMPEQELPQNTSEDEVEETSIDTSDEELSESTSSEHKILSRTDGNLRKVLLSNIRSIVYRDSIKSKELTIHSFMEPIINQKVDRFARLMNQLFPSKNSSSSK